MKLTENLSLSEAIKSQTAIRNNINNMPDESIINVMQLTAKKVFQPVRDHFNRPIYVSSFYRSPKLNKAIGGSPTSQHCKGEAIDIDCDSINSQIFEFIKDNLIFDQLIWEFGNETNPAWVHVSYTQERANRKQILVAYKENGKTKYNEHYKDNKRKA